MSLHYIAIEEFKNSPVFWARQQNYVDHIIINDAQLAFLKWFFEHYMMEQGDPAFMESDFYYNFHEVQENENIPEDKFFNLYDTLSPSPKKFLTAIHTSEWDIEFYLLSREQLVMLDFLIDFIADAVTYLSYAIVGHENPIEIS